MNFSDACYTRAKNYRDIPYLYFMKGDVDDTPSVDYRIDCESCVQVTHSHGISREDICKIDACCERYREIFML